MKRKIISIMFALVLAVSLMLVPAVPVAAQATINVPADHLTIQGAIDAAQSGDTIIVAAGTYPENVVLPNGKSITLLGAQADVDPTAGRAGPESVLEGWVGSLHGTGDGITLSDAVGTVVINGFTIQGYAYGIKGTESGGVAGATISYNILDNNGNDGTATNYFDALNNVGAGIRVYNMDASTISYNVVKNGERGIRLDDVEGDGSDGNTVSHNLIHDNEQYGIAIYTGGDGNTIEYNTIYNSADRGIQLGWNAAQTGNVIQYNEIYDVNNDGILITNATDFTIRGNTIYNVAFTEQTLGRPTGGDPSPDFSTQAVHGGIALVGTNSNVTITGNILHHNGEMGSGNPWGAISNAITSWATSDGIWLSGSSTGITVHGNSFYDNNEYGLENENTDVTTDATLNWWGATNGPSGQGAGDGDAVSTNVDYDPWLDSPVEAGVGAVSMTAASEEAVIGISVSPTFIDFGTITSGASVSGTALTVSNTGNVEINVDADITADTHFDDANTLYFYTAALRLNGSPSDQAATPTILGSWAHVEFLGPEPIVVDGSRSVATGLQAPPLIEAATTYIGTVVFWAEQD